MGFAQGFQVGANVRHNRDERRRLKTERDQELQKLGYEFDADGNMTVRPNSKAEVEQLQAKEAAQLAKSLQAKLLAQDTDRAFEDFSATGDASYLQKALDNDPVLKNAWAQRGVQMVSNIDFNNDTDLLAKAGLRPEAYDTPEKQDTIKKSMYKVYDGKGWSVGLANQAAAETGAMKRLGKRRGQAITDNHANFVNMLAGPKTSANTAEGHMYEKEIMAASEKYNIPADVIAAVANTENAPGDPNAVSPAGAVGIMQLMEGTANDLGVTDRTDPGQSIDGGTKYLSQMLDRYNGDLRLALAAYNAGPGNVDKYGGVPPFAETQNYVNKILGNIDEGAQYYNSSADDTINTILEHRRAIANAAQGTTNQNVDRKIQQKDRELTQTDRQLDIKEEENAIELIKANLKAREDGTTTKQKDLAAAVKTTQKLLDNFEGEETFFNTDFTDPQNYRKAYSDIIAIEKLEGTELSEADKKSITEIRQLIALANPASKLTKSQTGFIDKWFSDTKKYLFDNVGGTKAKSAYAAFRNSVRHALYGSALTEAEIKSFNEAYGTLGQQLGPVLEMFEANLAQVQAKLDSTGNLMNPYSAKVRLGADQKQLRQIRDALQQRIDHLKGLESGKKEGTQRRSLSEIMGFGGK